MADRRVAQRSACRPPVSPRTIDVPPSRCFTDRFDRRDVMSAAEARPAATPSNDPMARMRDILARQRQAHVKEGPPSAARRLEWLDRAINLLVGHKHAIADALREDFGHRSVHATLLTDVSG